MDVKVVKPDKHLNSVYRFIQLARPIGGEGPYFCEREVVYRPLMLRKRVPISLPRASLEQPAGAEMADRNGGGELARNDEAGQMKVAPS
jgi:hypothetical protein